MPSTTELSLKVFLRSSHKSMPNFILQPEDEVSAPGLSSRPYFNRYTEDAFDLCDVLSSFAPHTKASLNAT